MGRTCKENRNSNETQRGNQRYLRFLIHIMNERLLKHRIHKTLNVRVIEENNELNY